MGIETATENFCFSKIISKAIKVGPKKLDELGTGYTIERKIQVVLFTFMRQPNCLLYPRE